MTGPTPRHLKRFACRRLGLGPYFRRPGDGRRRGRIRSEILLWALIIGEVLRDGAFHAIERLVHSRARRSLGVSRRFGDDSLGYFTERLDPQPLRRALAGALGRAKRNKAFENARFIGLALDGTGASRSREAGCALCRPISSGEPRRITGHHHCLSMISVVVAGGLALPFDVEPYGPGDSELAASSRMLERSIELLGVRFAQYVVADSLYGGAPFLHLVQKLGLHAVVRLKENLPELFAAAEARFRDQPPHTSFEQGAERIELWDADDFDPWESLNWPAVRVLRYRQHKPNGAVVEAYWLTDFPREEVGSRALFTLAKTRWQIENQGFNEAKTRHGMERIRHHHVRSLLIGWLVICLALTIERLYRLRYLHRGGRSPYTAIELVRRLWISLGTPEGANTS